MNLLPPWGKPHLVLHVGPHKTGTTAIQEFCAANRDALAEAGYWYPSASRFHIQHIALPAAYLKEHPFIPASFLDRDPAEVIDSIRDEVPPGFRVILSSEVFWELLMASPSTFTSMLARLKCVYRVTIVYFKRPKRDQAWSAMKHLARAGCGEDAALKFATLLSENESAFRYFHKLRCRKMAVPYGGDSVSRFVNALAGITTADRFWRRIHWSPEFRTLATAVGRPRDRVNASQEHPKAAAFTFEFSRRLRHAPAIPTDSREHLEWFLQTVLQMAVPLEQWSVLPEEDALLDRTIAAQGQPGSLLTREEAKAWCELCGDASITKFADQGRCAETLAVIRAADGPGIDT